MIVEFAHFVDRGPLESGFQFVFLCVFGAVLLKVNGLDVVDGWNGGIGGHSCTRVGKDEVAVVLCTGGAGLFMGGPVSFLTGLAAV